MILIDKMGTHSGEGGQGLVSVDSTRIVWTTRLYLTCLTAAVYLSSAYVVWQVLTILILFFWNHLYSICPLNAARKIAPLIRSPLLNPRVLWILLNIFPIRSYNDKSRENNINRLFLRNCEKLSKLKQPTSTIRLLRSPVRNPPE